MMDMIIIIVGHSLMHGKFVVGDKLSCMISCTDFSISFAMYKMSGKNYSAMQHFHKF